MSSILERAMAMQREQENFISDKAKVNAEQSRAKGANKKKLFMEHSGDDDEFETVGNVYSMTEEKIKTVKREDMFSSKSHGFEAVKASKEELEKYGIKKGMTAEDIALMRAKIE
jgi:hypothetical protein